MGKLMIHGEVANKTIETLGIHTGTSASKELDIPLVADRLGKYSEEDIDDINENLSKHKCGTIPAELINGNKIISVTFDTPYENPPVVVATPLFTYVGTYDRTYQMHVADVTKEGFKIGFYVTTNTSVGFNWIAIS